MGSEPPPTSPPPWSMERALAFGAGAFPYLAALLLAVALLAQQEPISRQGSHAGRMFLAAFALLLVHLTRQLRELDPGLGLDLRTSAAGVRAVAARALLTLWAAAALAGVANYYQFDRRVATTVGDYADATYYYLNSKYFEELGYTRLYRAMLVADEEGPRKLAHVRHFRDLVDYERMLPRRLALHEAEAVKAYFSDARWESFRDDLAFITQHQAHGGWRYFFIDHGYNPPPSWTIVGGTLAKLIPVEHMKVLTSIDMLLVFALMVAIAWVASPFTMLVALVFYCCTFSGRWPVLGQAILRFDWLCALVGGALALRCKRHGLAGGLLTYALAIRVFPGIFGLPYVVVMVRDSLRARRIAPHHLRFIAGAALCALVLGGGSLASYGAEAYTEAAVNLRLHASPESFSSHRVGLGDVILYEGEWTPEDFRATGRAQAKREQLWLLNPTLKVIGAGAALFVIFYCWRSREPVHRLLWLGIYPLFALTNPQINYYNLRLLLILLHMERWGDYRHRIGLYMLFAIEVVTQYAKVDDAVRYAVTAMTSVGMAIYLGVMAMFLVYDLFQGFFGGEPVAGPSTRAEAAGEAGTEGGGDGETDAGQPTTAGA